MSPKLIRLMVFALASISIVFRIKAFWNYYTIRLPQNDFSTGRIIGQHIQLITLLMLPVITLFIVFRSRSNNSLYLAFFLAAYAVLHELPLVTDGVLYLANVAGSIIVGNLFILSMQYFPTKITNHKVEQIIRRRWLQRYLKTFLKPARLWIEMSLVLSGLSVVEYFVPSLQSALSNFLILLTGFAYLFINFRLTTGEEHSKILWIFWGLLMYILILLIYTAIFLYSEPAEVVNIIVAIALSLSLLLSFVMSLFFANAFDTGVLIRKTAINAGIFLLAVLLYNTIEHFLLHWIAHALHISDAVVASLLSGLLVLFISPLHHRLTHFLSKKLKSKEQHKASPSLSHS